VEGVGGRYTGTTLVVVPRAPLPWWEGQGEDNRRAPLPWWEGLGEGDRLAHLPILQNACANNCWQLSTNSGSPASSPAHRSEYSICSRRMP
jgi:hypothetical protein